MRTLSTLLLALALAGGARAEDVATLRQKLRAAVASRDYDAAVGYLSSLRSRGNVGPPGPRDAAVERVVEAHLACRRAASAVRAATSLRVVELHPGQVGVVLGDPGGRMRTLQPGLRTYCPETERVVVVECGLRCSEVSFAQLQSRDYFAIRLTLAMVWRIPPAHAARVVGALGLGRVTEALSVQARSVLREQIAKHSAAELVAWRTQLDAQLARAIDVRARRLGLSVLEIRVRDLRTPPQIRLPILAALEHQALRKARAQLPARRATQVAATRALRAAERALAELPAGGRRR